MEEHAEKKRTKSRSRAHRKANRYHQRKKENKLKDITTSDSDKKGATDKIEGATDNNQSEIDKEITKYLAGATTNLAKTKHQEYQTVLEDIHEVSSSKSQDSDGRSDRASKSDDSVTAVIDLPTETSNQDENESEQDLTLHFQEENEWEELCEQLQSYTFDGDDKTWVHFPL